MERVADEVRSSSEKTLPIERDLRRSAALREALWRVLAALPMPAYVVSSTRVQPANPFAASRLGVEGAEFARRLSSAAARDQKPDGFRWIPLPGGKFVALESSEGVDTRFSRAVTRWGLSPRQAEVLRGLVSGLSNADIAGQLGCRPRTVEAHVAAILQRADARSRLELVAAYWSDL